MAEYKGQGAVAETIARVIYTKDLTELAPEDLDVFLNALQAEPFTEEQMRRILGRLALDQHQAGGRDGSRTTSVSGRAGTRRVARAKVQGYRLVCEELENRLPPSVYGASFGEPTLAIGVTWITGPSAETARLEVSVHIIEVVGQTDPGTSSVAAVRDLSGRHVFMSTNPDTIATALNGVFASEEYHGPADFAAGPDDHVDASLPWESVFSEMDCPCTVSCAMELAG
jgi:hypothetical protein